MLRYSCSDTGSENVVRVWADLGQTHDPWAALLGHPLKTQAGLCNRCMGLTGSAKSFWAIWNESVYRMSTTNRFGLAVLILWLGGSIVAPPDGYSNYLAWGIIFLVGALFLVPQTPQANRND